MPSPSSCAAEAHAQRAIDEAMIQAAGSGDLPEVLRLLPQANLLAAAGSQKVTALSAAATAGHAECVRALIPFAPHLELETRGHRALWDAIQADQAECAAALVEVSDPSFKGAFFGENALSLAAHNGRAECVRVLLPFCDPTETDDFGFSALAAAARSGHAACVRAFFSCPDASIWGQMAPSGATALMIAAEAGQSECVEALLARSDPQAVDNNDQDAFDYAVGGEHWACVDLLAPFAGEERAHRAFKRPGAAQAMPRWAARVEAGVLAREFSAPGPLPASAPVSASGSPSPPGAALGGAAAAAELGAGAASTAGKSLGKGPRRGARAL